MLPLHIYVVPPEDATVTEVFSTFLKLLLILSLAEWLRLLYFNCHQLMSRAKVLQVANDYHHSLLL
jgi:hypothetical protein